jgi:hypothetical protein
MEPFMLEVQKYLLSRSLEELSAELAINVTPHASLPMAILNYDQIGSPKTHPIVRECRALVLDTRTWAVVAKSFSRFFNWGEVETEMGDFDFSDFVVQSKEDGSLVLIYHYDGQWHVNTRGTFGGEPLRGSNGTWRDAICRAMNLTDDADFDRYFDRDCAYVGEFCSPWNKVVRRYERPAVYLLTAFRGTEELHWSELEGLAASKVMLSPERYEFHGIDQIREFLDHQAATDATFEGVVIRDRHGNRWKLKSSTYLGLHKLRGEGDCWNPKYLLPFILKGEEAELLTYFPEAKEAYFSLKADVLGRYAEVLELWNDHKDIEVQKDFAMAVKEHPFAPVLFQVRKQFGRAATGAQVRGEFKANEPLILKRLAT